MKMGKKAIAMTGVKDEEFYEGMGKQFVAMTARIGYARYLNNLGRFLRDFILNLDNFHDYLKVDMFSEKWEQCCKSASQVIKIKLFLTLTLFNDYFKYTFPRMKAPSFFVEEETETSECTR